MARLQITDEMRSMILSAVWAAQTDRAAALCCDEDHTLCAAIVGDKFAPVLQCWAYEFTGCCQLIDQQGRPMIDGEGNPVVAEERVVRIIEGIVEWYIDRVEELEHLDTEGGYVL